MKFLIDGHRDRVAFRKLQWSEGVEGQLLTPLTRYSRGEPIFAIDNGAFSGLREASFISLLKREWEHRKNCLFVCIPDKVGCHVTTERMWGDFNYLADGYTKAFVAQDGYQGMPDEAGALFIGGTDNFKESEEAQDAVLDALARNKHVHIGRVNSPARFMLYHVLGAHTCDGSGVSRYDHMLPLIRQAYEAYNARSS